MSNKAFLIILDGWGIGPREEADAIFQANTPYYDQLWQECPHSTLVTHGLAVGLPEGQMGNSEVGHLNLGAGRVVFQDLTRIDQIIQNRGFDVHPKLDALANYCRSGSKACHLIGLVSDGGVHSHIQHLMALIESLEQRGINRIFVHAIMDGRDTDPHSGRSFIETLEQFLEGKTTKVSTVIGRYYAMDRDQRWERVRKAYDLLVYGKGHAVHAASEAIRWSYQQGITDEFIEACKVGSVAEGIIQSGDAVCCFNFRTDRLRQLTRVLIQPETVQDWKEQAIPLHYMTLTRYDGSFKNVEVLFEPQDLANTLGECISRYGLTQLRIAETEKYPHVSYFFSGGREKEYAGEQRILIPSPKVATYDLKPEMSALELTQALMQVLEENAPDFICLNFANTDMVGHTGVFAAAVQAAETVDQCLAKLIPLAMEKNYDVLVLADHGNADCMINEDGSPNTAHTKNPVPCILVTRKNGLHLNHGKLADVAPTLLELLDLPIPVEMTGVSLLNTSVNSR